MAYRSIGVAARMCLELGLHRRDAMLNSVTKEEELVSVAKLFWSIYSLDRRWSFGAGLPFVIQDEDIDCNLPEPVRFCLSLPVFLFETASSFLPFLLPSLFNDSY